MYLTVQTVQGDLLLANKQFLGLTARHDRHVYILLVYANGLFEDQQYRRALVAKSQGHCIYNLCIFVCLCHSLLVLLQGGSESTGTGPAH